ncbi:MAG: 5,10-methylenetetrahydrofolate reductase [Planctomycetes bacterium]|nr:5,10-methylenetetrahydrofolate reductase [Planctomycetota bacterium]
MSKLSESLAAGKFTLTGEIGPPKGIHVDHMFEEADKFLRGKIVAVNVTDIQSAVMRTSSVSCCVRLRQMSIEPVLQMVCRDRNQLALQSDLLGASILGIENVLALTGDHTVLGDHKGAQPVYDLDSVSLLHAMTGLEKGKDLAGNDLEGAPKFFKGAVVTPCAEPVEPQVIKLEKKVEAGAQFIQTQAVYDPKAFEQFMKMIGHIKVPILVGIVFLKSAGMAKFMNKNVAGVFVPAPLIEELEKVGKDEAALKRKSVEIAARLIKDMKGMCQGVHFMPLGWDDVVPPTIEAAGL